MRANLYPKLAWDGIRKNKRFYLPYLLTCIGMVMMCYILRYLASMPSLNDMPGGSTMTMILELGFLVVTLFAVIFLFYTNSFLMRRRQKEFGLYNMLGMGKNIWGCFFSGRPAFFLSCPWPGDFSSASCFPSWRSFRCSC